MLLEELLTQEITTARAHLAKLEAALETLRELGLIEHDIEQHQREILRQASAPAPVAALRCEWSCPNGVEPALWEQWMKIRSDGDAPMLERVYRTTLLELEKFEKSGFSPQQVVSYAVAGRLLGLYPPGQNGIQYHPE
jgi:hypothetical protein